MIEHVLTLEMVAGAGDAPPMSKTALNAGLRELIAEAYRDLKPIEQAPFEITNWAPDTAEPAKLATYALQATE